METDESVFRLEKKESPKRAYLQLPSKSTVLQGTSGGDLVGEDEQRPGDEDESARLSIGWSDIEVWLRT